MHIPIFEKAIAVSSDLYVTNITFNSVNCFLDSLRKLITFCFIATRIVISSQTEGIYIDFRNRRRRLSLRVSIVFFTWTKRLIDYEGR